MISFSTLKIETLAAFFFLLFEVSCKQDGEKHSGILFVDVKYVLLDKTQRLLQGEKNIF